MLYQRIRTFLEVANCLSFSQAASNLYISQQAVTRQIAALERELGVRLFYRTTRQVALTPAGSILRNDFTQINRQIGDSIRRARELDASGKALLRVGFLSALSRKDIILPVTDYLIKGYPELELEIQLMDFIALRNSLLDNKLDFCVTTSNDWELWPGVQTTVLQRKQFQVVYSARHPLAQRREIALEDLAQYTQLVLPNENLLEGVEQWGRKIPYRRAVFCPDISTLMVRLELGEGFALLTKVIEGHDAAHLRYWDVPFPEAHAEIVCICPENARDAVKRVISGIRGNEIVKI
ncbi:MAG: LysR family transcriptional regulator [Oscillospiraceae bacterium]|nr:LysR family transcriptional regulator [Oscillospiraceae bacterium]